MLTWCARFVAPLCGLVDRPDSDRKLHRKTTPLLGGVACYFAIVVTLLASLLIDRSLFAPDFGCLLRRLALFASATLYCLVGWWDDWRPLRPRTKFMLQIAASLPFVAWGQSIESIYLFGTEVHLGVMSGLFVIGWLVSCSNVVNLLDGSDGLAGTIGVIGAVTISALSAMGGNISMAMISAVLAGSLTGFLVHNLPPARIFLGDAGSLTIGFLLGAFSIEASRANTTEFALVAPLIALSLPVFDTIMAILRRKLSGKSIGAPDRAHIHHRLQQRGLSNVQTLVTIASVSFAMSLAAILATYGQNDFLGATICLAMLSLLVVGRVFGHEETSGLYHRIKSVGGTLLQSFSPLGNRGLRTSVQQLFSEESLQSWNEAQRQAAKLGGVQLEMTFKDTLLDQADRKLTWKHTEPPELEAPMWNLQFSTLRDDHRRINVMATGYKSDQSNDEELNELLGILHSLCQKMATSEEPPAIANRANSVPSRLTEKEPIILPFTKPTPVSASEEQQRAA